MVVVAEPRRAALYVDFDNVFTALAALGQSRALAFAKQPGQWLRWLAEGGDGGGPRRMLIRRCYLNPAGSTAPASGGIPAAGDTSQLPFAQFRAALVRDGFEVVDCPRLTMLKNAADMAMALDILDALAHPTRFEEFLILSGDADFTPLLHRLRAHDRRSLVVAPPNAAKAFMAAADQVLSLDAFAVQPQALRPANPAAAVSGAARPTATAAPHGARAAPAPHDRTAPVAAPIHNAAVPPPRSADPGSAEAQRERLLTVIRHHLTETGEPLHLGALGKHLCALGPWVQAGRYGGAGTLTNLVQGSRDWALEAGPAGGWLFDPARHRRPSSQPT
jgi:NYN domain